VVENILSRAAMIARGRFDGAMNTLNVLNKSHKNHLILH
jgi:hypothetical protein